MVTYHLFSFYYVYRYICITMYIIHHYFLSTSPIFRTLFWFIYFVYIILFQVYSSVCTNDMLFYIHRSSYKKVCYTWVHYSQGNLNFCEWSVIEAIGPMKVTSEFTYRIMSKENVAFNLKSDQKISAYWPRVILGSQLSDV